MGNWVKTDYPYVAACALAGGGQVNHPLCAEGGLGQAASGAFADAADACFAIYYKRGGLKICEMVGRASQGWTARKAYEHLRALLREQGGQWIRSFLPHVAYREVRRHPHDPEPDKLMAVFYHHGEINICRKLGWASEGWTEKRAHDHLMEQVRIQRLAGLGPQDDAPDTPETRQWRKLHGLLQLRQAKDMAWSFFCALSAGGMLGPELLDRVYGPETAHGMARTVFPAMFGMAWANFFFAASLTGLYLYGCDRGQRQAARDLADDDSAYASHAPGLLRSFAGVVGAEAATLTGLTLMLE
ncbi:hypothetical protein [Paucidesulfovibrio longus]|uniref:hypothetical protein n=1 Tax=Paucidesulfovibrio longus TaxID=889 RepID=UPI0012DFB348|nr:hypothetical protein [Paucidesulfovibrio longus]